MEHARRGKILDKSLSGSGGRLIILRGHNFPKYTVTTINYRMNRFLAILDMVLIKNFIKKLSITGK